MSTNDNINIKINTNRKCVLSDLVKSQTVYDVLEVDKEETSFEYAQIVFKMSDQDWVNSTYYCKNCSSHLDDWTTHYDLPSLPEGYDVWEEL